MFFARAAGVQGSRPLLDGEPCSRVFFARAAGVQGGRPPWMRPSLTGNPPISVRVVRSQLHIGDTSG